MPKSSILNAAKFWEFMRHKTTCGRKHIYISQFHWQRKKFAIHFDDATVFLCAWIKYFSEHESPLLMNFHDIPHRMFWCLGIFIKNCTKHVTAFEWKYLLWAVHSVSSVGIKSSFRSSKQLYLFLKKTFTWTKRLHHSTYIFN